MEPRTFVETLGAERAAAILRTDDAERGALAMEAAIRGGFRIVELTLTTPHALELIGELSGRPGIVVGAGTVLGVDEARAAVEAGARYLVSPVVDEGVIAAARDLGVAVMPGCHTPTELLRAHRAGAPLQKLFPAPAGGPAWLRSVRGPLPFLRVVPTNGVDAENAIEWLAAGAYALGFVATLFDPRDLEARRWARIEERAATILERVRSFDGREPVAAGRRR